jgi:heme-degrading monooxygenase HmoA
MITVGMNYQVLDGKGGQFEAMFNKVLSVMRDTPGHTRSSLYRDVNDGNSYLIVSEWGERSAFDQFVASERFKRVVDWGKEQILAARPRHEIYESSASAPAAPKGGCPVRH